MEHPWHEDLKARMENYELACRMQMQVPGVIDLEKEDVKTKEAYGIGQHVTDAFGRKCLLARKLVEQGVRFVQLYAGTWDSHDYIERSWQSHPQCRPTHRRLDRRPEATRPAGGHAGRVVR